MIREQCWWPLAASIAAAYIAGWNVTANAEVGAPSSKDAEQREVDQRDARAFASDAMLTARIKTALLANDAVKGLKIDVDSRGGAVSLNGTVESQTQSVQAETTARQVENVVSVDNRLVVIAASGDSNRRSAATPADDAIITTRIKTALLADADIEGMMIDVDANRGVVTLSGQVESPSQFHKVEAIARQTPGVSSVNNQLSVKNAPSGHDRSSRSEENDTVPGDDSASMAQVPVRLEIGKASERELIMAHRLTDSSPVARYRPLPQVKETPKSSSDIRERI